MADLRNVLADAIRAAGREVDMNAVDAVLPVVERYLATSRAEVERLEQENARLLEQRKRAVHAWVRNIPEGGAEDRVQRVFADADVEGVDLNAMTVTELTALVMSGFRSVARDGGEES